MDSGLHGVVECDRRCPDAPVLIPHHWHRSIDPGRFSARRRVRVLALACRLGAEGIVSKRLGSSYRSGPCHAWIKCKNPEYVAAQRDARPAGFGKRHEPRMAPTPQPASLLARAWKLSSLDYA